MNRPSPLLCALQQTVQAAIDAGHVGVPVFVRCVAHTAPDGDGLSEALDRLAAVAGSWLGAPARRVYVQGGGEKGQITATIQYMGGPSALVSANLAPAEGGPCIDLMLLGNTGAIYHDGAALPPAAMAALGPPCGDLPALPDVLRCAMEESLRTGQPVAVDESR